jgi:hypothetical protein
VQTNKHSALTGDASPLVAPRCEGGCCYGGRCRTLNPSACAPCAYPIRTSSIDTSGPKTTAKLHFLSFLSLHRRTRIITIIPYPPDNGRSRAQRLRLDTQSLCPSPYRAAKARLVVSNALCSTSASQSAVGLSSSEIDLSGRTFQHHVCAGTSCQDASFSTHECSSD